MFLIYCVGMNQQQKNKKKTIKLKKTVSINKINGTEDTERTQQLKRGEEDPFYNDLDDDKNTEYIRNIIEDGDHFGTMAGGKQLFDDQDAKKSMINS